MSASRKSGTDHDIPIFYRTALRISAGVIVWALHFTAIYGLTALACARGWTGLILPSVIGATVVAVPVLIAIIVAGLRRGGEFEGWLSATLAGFGLIAVIYEAIPVFILSAACENY